MKTDSGKKKNHKPGGTSHKVTRLSEVELEKMIDSIDEAIIGCDKNGLVNIYNRANERREKMSRKDILNRPVNDIYDFHSGQSLLLQAIRERRAIIDQYQEYTLYDSGVYVEILCSTVPIMEGDEIIGAVSVMKDYSRVKKLSKIIMDLHSNLLESNQKKASKPGGAVAKHYFSDIIGNNSLLQETLQWARKTAANDLPVLISGETGTGKELLAQGIHNASNRADQPFIAINCAAIPENLLEGLLFGTVKGAFTGAVDRPGLFEQASEGTLVLDEINSMSLALQTKLLRVIQEEAVRRVGDVKERSINTRLISIANTDPLQAIKKGALREDLYYRIAYISLHMPPLKERLDDLPILVDYLIGKYNRKLNLNVQGLSAELFSQVEKYPWPGNIRELEQFLAAGMSALDSGKNIIGLSDVPPNIKRKFSSGQSTKARRHNNYNLDETLEKVERRVVETALKRNNWNVSKTAKELGLRRQSLQYRIKKHSLELP